MFCRYCWHRKRINYEIICLKCTYKNAADERFIGTRCQNHVFFGEKGWITKGYGFIAALFVVVFLVACCGDGSSTAANENSNGAGSEFDASSNTLKDSRDGKTYKTVKIGNRVWMAENLDYETANSICGEMEYLTLYGCRYSWDEAKTVCPGDWRLPRQAEWNTLIEFVGDSSTAGKILKATNT